MWAREKNDDSGQRGGAKESSRWIEGYERIAEMVPDMPSSRLAYVADRDAGACWCQADRMVSSEMGNPHPVQRSEERLSSRRNAVGHD